VVTLNDCGSIKTCRLGRSRNTLSGFRLKSPGLDYSVEVKGSRSLEAN